MLESSRNWRIPMVVGVVLLTFLAAVQTSHATAVTPEMAAAASSSAPDVFDLVKNVAKLPVAVGKVLRLPLGVVEIGLSPLPGPSLTGGFQNIGGGVMGIPDLTFRILGLPLAALNSLDKIVAKNIPSVKWF